MTDFSPVSVVIVGHVDHGKSTFIGRFLFDTKQLTSEKIAELESRAEGAPVDFAHVMDQFKEEREKNITIDTAQTFFSLNDRPYIFVDAPGHKEYLKNMITGATQAKNALLLLDIKEGIREQTEKHIQILKMLGISNLGVLLNKMDLVGFDEKTFNESVEKLKAVLAKHKVDVRWFIPISAKQGDNVVSKSDSLPWYQGPTVKEAVLSFEPDDLDLSQGALRFPVQLRHLIKKDSFLLGRVETGRLKKGQTLDCLPGGEKVTVKKILVHPDKIKEAAAGASVALEVNAKSEINRGAVLCEEGTARTASVFSGPMFWASMEPASVGNEFQVQCRTQDAPGKIKFLKDPFSGESKDTVQPGDIVSVEFELSTPLLIEAEPLESPFRRIVIQKNGEPAGAAIVESVS